MISSLLLWLLETMARMQDPSAQQGLLMRLPLEPAISKTRDGVGQTMDQLSISSLPVLIMLRGLLMLEYRLSWRLLFLSRRRYNITHPGWTNETWIRNLNGKYLHLTKLSALPAYVLITDDFWQGGTSCFWTPGIYAINSREGATQSLGLLTRWNSWRYPYVQSFRCSPEVAFDPLILAAKTPNLLAYNNHYDASDKEVTCLFLTLFVSSL